MHGVIQSYLNKLLVPEHNSIAQLWVEGAYIHEIINEMFIGPLQTEKEVDFNYLCP